MHRIAVISTILIASFAVPAYAEEVCKLPERHGNQTARTGSWGARVSGSGNMTTQTHPVSGFTSVRIRAPFTVEARASERERVTVRVDDNLQAMVEAKVEDGVLVLGLVHGASFTTNTQPVVTVHYIKLAAVAVEGSGDFIANNLRAADGFNAATSGSGDVCLGGVKVPLLALSVSGSGDVRAIGGADQLSISIAGSGDIVADKLVARTVKVAIAGSGDAKVNAIEALDINIAGSGDVRYVGTPKIKQAIAGSGNVKSLRAN